MDSNKIKSFAKQARLLLLEGVLQRLRYWGFNEDGTNSESMQTTQGGYLFRGEVYTDTTVPQKWTTLNKRIGNGQDLKDVVEEAAYTWFNRLMAIKILEENGYLASTLTYSEGIRVPELVQNAKRGQYHLRKESDKSLLLEYLKDDRESEAFGLLVLELCNSNRLLHDVFGRIDDYTEILLPQNLMQKDGLLDLINGESISGGDYKEVELIGWLYQFYISDKKDEVFAGFKKNKKARAEDIPAATQIFTPKWIVKYMVENTVGKIYLDYEPDSTLKQEMKYLVENEGDKDGEAIISDITELTLIDPACGSGHILVTGFELLFKMYREEGYTAKQAVDSILKNNIYGLDIDDRAMQLARFAVLLKAAEFDSGVLNRSVLPHIYSFSEATLTESLGSQYYSKGQSDWYGLQGMKLNEKVSLSWTESVVDRKTKREKEVKKSKEFKEGTVLHKDVLDVLMEHCDASIKVDYAEDLEGFWGKDKMGYGYSEFYYAIELLQQGKNIGSALKIRLSEDALEHINKRYQEWNALDCNMQLGAFDKLLWDNLRPHLEVLFALTKRYTSVVANPPYMGQKSMNGNLKEYVNKEYPDTKSDLCTVFIEVLPKLANKSGKYGFIVPPSWMFLSSFEKLRTNILKTKTIDSLLHLSRGVFGADFGSMTTVISNETTEKRINRCGTYFRLVERTFQEFYQGHLEELFIIAKTNKNFKYDFQQYSKDDPKFIHSEDGVKLYYPNIPQTNFSKIPGSPIAYWVKGQLVNLFEEVISLEEEAKPRKGLVTLNDKYFFKDWSELDYLKIGFNFKDKEEALNSGKKWIPVQKGGGFKKWYGNNTYCINWENDGKELKKYIVAKYKGGSYTKEIRSEDKYFQECISWSGVSSGLPGFRYVPTGFIFSSSGPCAFPELSTIKYLIGLLNSKVTHKYLEVLSPTLSILSGHIAKIPALYSKEEVIKRISSSAINFSKRDWDSTETSWDFEQSPLLNECNSLEESYTVWNKDVTEDFFQLHENEEALNRIFIDIYGLQDELTPDVALKDITILQNELDHKSLEALEPMFRERGKDGVALPIKKEEVLSQFVSYAIGVFLGRYRLDRPGLNIAHPNASEEEVASYSYQGHHIEIDEDGILPMMGEGCAFPDDALVRTKDLIYAIWGEESLTENINFLQECLGMDLDKWLREKFWGYHTKMYKKKPIYWMFSSNVKKPQKAAFKVLVYMHRMDKYTVQKIQRNYLHPHQEDIKQRIQKLEENEARLSREEFKHLEELRNWEIECRDYNEVLKELANQQIVFDLDDGVSVNYAKFEGAVAKIK